MSVPREENQSDREREREREREERPTGAHLCQSPAVCPDVSEESSRTRVRESDDFFLKESII